MIHSIVSLSVLMFVSGANAAPLPAGPAQCDAAAVEVRNKISELNYAQFDQTDGQGWRKLWDAQCYHSGAKLIDSYIAAHQELSDQERRNLLFHQGQALAFAGDVDAAVESFEQCRRAEDVSNGFRWNAYLRGTIAFLKRNKEQLASAHDELAAHSGNYGNATNRRVLASFLEYFDASYAVAYSKPRR
jgi:hypothetical protein